MFVIPGILSLGFAAISSGVVVLSARVFAARALIGCGPRVGLGLDQAPWKNISIARKIAFALSGPFACYLLASFLFTASLLADGKPATDSRNMHVWVMPDGPVSTAGIRGGDEIISIDDVPILSWPELTEQVSKHPGTTLRVAVRHRDGTTQVFDVAPGPNAKLGMITQQENDRVGFGSAIASGALAVPRMWITVARSVIAILSGTPATHALAPMIFGSHTARFTIGGAAERVATLVGYYFFVLTILLASVFWPGARWFASTRTTAEK
jgi:membrane-associated protease RseP (regulator of RpoE activity)